MHFENRQGWRNYTYDPKTRRYYHPQRHILRGEEESHGWENFRRFKDKIVQSFQNYARGQENAKEGEMSFDLRCTDKYDIEEFLHSLGLEVKYELVNNVQAMKVDISKIKNDVVTYNRLLEFIKVHESRFNHPAESVGKKCGRVSSQIEFPECTNNREKVHQRSARSLLVTQTTPKTNKTKVKEKSSPKSPRKKFGLRKCWRKKKKTPTDTLSLTLSDSSSSNDLIDESAQKGSSVTKPNPTPKNRTEDNSSLPMPSSKCTEYRNFTRANRYHYPPVSSCQNSSPYLQEPLFILNTEEPARPKLSPYCPHPHTPYRKLKRPGCTNEKCSSRRSISNEVGFNRNMLKLPPEDLTVCQRLIGYLVHFICPIPPDSIGSKTETSRDRLERELQQTRLELAQLKQKIKHV